MAEGDLAEEDRRRALRTAGVRAGMTSPDAPPLVAPVPGRAARKARHDGGGTKKEAGKRDGRRGWTLPRPRVIALSMLAAIGPPVTTPAARSAWPSSSAVKTPAAAASAPAVAPPPDPYDKPNYD